MRTIAAAISLFLLLAYCALGQATKPPPKELLDAMITNRIQLAEQAQKRGDFVLADAHIMRLLAVAPKDPRVIAFRDTNEKLKTRIGRGRPDPFDPNYIEMEKQRRTNQGKAATLVQNAKICYERGMWDGAENQLKKAVQLNPENKAAYYYLDLIREQRAR